MHFHVAAVALGSRAPPPAAATPPEVALLWSSPLCDDEQPEGTVTGCGAESAANRVADCRPTHRRARRPRAAACNRTAADTCRVSIFSAVSTANGPVDGVGSVVADEARRDARGGGGLPVRSSRKPTPRETRGWQHRGPGAFASPPRVRRRGRAEEGPAALRRIGPTQPRDVRRQRRIQPWSLIPDCYELQCKGKVIGGFGTDLWRIRAAELQ
jgi:hypothetical protein